VQTMRYTGELLPCLDIRKLGNLCTGCEFDWTVFLTRVLWALFEVAKTVGSGMRSVEVAINLRNQRLLS